MAETDPIGQRRRPYHYQTLLDNGSINQTDASEDFWSERANYSRYLYYNRLRRDTETTEDDNILLIPPHVVPSEFFYPEFAYSADGRQSSLVTIFALWNTMMGTSLLSMPWAIEKAGLVPGLVLLCLMAGICFYTASKILETFEAHQGAGIYDFAVLCKRLLGRWAQVSAVVFSALTLLGACIVYWVLMSNFLYRTVDHIYATWSSNGSVPWNASTPDMFACLLVYCATDNQTTDSPEEDDNFHKYWDLYKTVPFVLLVVLLPLSSVTSTSFFTKFNSLGTFSVLYLLVFVIVKGFKYGINVDLKNPDSPHFVPLYNPGFAALAGMLSLAFFIHNCIITIMKNNRYPEHNKRDLGIAYVFVAATYCIIGGAFFVIFPLKKDCISDNFLDNFQSFDRWSFTARIFLFFQMTTVFPLLVYILRVQVIYAVFKREPDAKLIFLGNLIVMSIAIFFAIKLPSIGTIIRFTGAICGFVYLFFLPVALYLRWQSNINNKSTVSIVLHSMLVCCAFGNLVLQFIV